VGPLGRPGAVTTVVREAASVFEDMRIVPVTTTTERFDPAATRNVVVIGVRR
jgi:hypothetical protein